MQVRSALMWRTGLTGPLDRRTAAGEPDNGNAPWRAGDTNSYGPWRAGGAGWTRLRAPAEAGRPGQPYRRAYVSRIPHRVWDP